MSIKSTVRDPQLGHEGAVRPLRDPHGDKGIHGQVVLTEPFRDLQATGLPALNPTYGIEMAIALPTDTGTPDVTMFTETDTGDWVFSQISGTGASVSTTRPQTDSNSIEWAPANLGDVIQLNNGADLDSSLYTNISFGINVDRRWGVGDDCQFYCVDTGTGLDVGSRVNLSDYFDPATVDTWSGVVVPFTDLATAGATFNAVRWEITPQSGAAPEFFIDDVNLKAGGEPQVFRLEAAKGERIYLHGVRISMMDDIAATQLNGTVIGLKPRDFMGVSRLANGILVRRRRNGETLFVATMHDIKDLVTNTGAEVRNAFGDTGQTLITFEAAFTDPVLIEGPPDDNHLDFILQDDLNGLTSLTFWAKASTEYQ